MDPITWLHLLSWSLKVMTLADFPSSISVETQWRTSGELPFVWTGRKEALEILFKIDGNNRVSNRYLLLPSCDLALIRTDVDSPAIQPECLGVTPFCLVYRLPIDFSPLSTTEESLQKRIELIFRNHLNIQSYEPVQIENGITLPGEVQVIRLEEFPNSVDLQIAVAGRVSYDSLRYRFPGKMIHLTLIPDQGEPAQRWIKGGNDDTRCDFENFSDLFAHLEELLREASSQKSFPDITTYYHQAVEQLNVFFDDRQGDNNCRSLFYSWIQRLFCQSRQVSVTPEWDLFPDYQPKESPDEVLDFRNALQDQLITIPTSHPDHMKSLLKFFRLYRRLARKNPGNWEEGNMILGARAKEYIPSDEELILAEVGKRIMGTMETFHQDQRSKVLRGLWCLPRILRFSEFTFTHSDVMGSGRFFYVDEIIPIIFKLSR